MNYSIIYQNLIKKRREQPINHNDGDCAYHHIIPISEGGIDTPRKEQFNHEGTNIIGLTLREHIFAHQLLARIYDDSKMWYAANMMITVNGYKVNSRLAAMAKHKSIEFKKSLKGTLSPRFGIKASKETRQKIADANCKRTVSEETKEKQRQSHIGKKMSEQARKNMREAQRRPDVIARKSKAMKNRKLAAETIEKIRIANTGKRRTEEQIEAMRKTKLCKKVLQIDAETGQVINEFFSQKEASRQLGIQQGGISQCISGKLKQYGGYIWRKG